VTQAPRTARWVADVLGCAVDDLEISVMAGGLTSVMHRIEVRGAAYVLREMTVEPWATHAEGLLAREARSQRILHGGAVPVPRCVGVDPVGTAAGVPALLMTALPGRVVLDRWDPAIASALAQVLVDVHTTATGAGERPRAYQSWAGPGPWDVPGWAGDPDVWERAHAVASRPAPDLDHVLLHRDPNPSNLLWIDDGHGLRVTGVVDWVETSWGPADLDVAHCAKYVAMLHGPDAADELAAAYEAAGGRLAAASSDRAWWTATVVLAVRGPERGIELWREQGLVDVGLDLARTRLEEHLRRTLDGRTL
jgi:aminoglycoside phosphotransferase (APT) family kinase protein